MITCHLELIDKNKDKDMDKTKTNTNTKTNKKTGQTQKTINIYSFLSCHWETAQQSNFERKFGVLCSWIAPDSWRQTQPRILKLSGCPDNPSEDSLDQTKQGFYTISLRQELLTFFILSLFQMRFCFQSRLVVKVGIMTGDSIGNKTFSCPKWYPFK